MLSFFTLQGSNSGIKIIFILSPLLFNQYYKNSLIKYFIIFSYQRIRGSNQTGEVPVNYRCFKCHKPGHWIKNCPLGHIVVS